MSKPPKSPTFILLEAIHPRIPRTMARGSLGIDFAYENPVDAIATLLDGDREAAERALREFSSGIKIEPCPCQFLIDVGVDIYDITSAMEELVPQIEAAQIEWAAWEAENIEEAVEYRVKSAKYDALYADPIYRMVLGAKNDLAPTPPLKKKHVNDLVGRFKRLCGAATTIASAYGCVQAFEVLTPVRAAFEARVAEEAAAEEGEAPAGRGVASAYGSLVDDFGVLGTGSEPEV
jgi:hypothetical protein